LSYPLSVCVFIGLILWEAIAFGLLGLAASLLVRRGRSLLWMLVPVWVTIESLWPRVFSWATAHAYIGFPPILQVAEFTGTAGVTACVVLASVAIARLWLNKMNRIAIFESVVAIVFVAFACGWGSYTLQDWEKRLAEADTVRVAAVQVDPTYVESLRQMQELSDSVTKQADLILWPESTLGHYHVSLNHFRDSEHTMANSEMPNPAIEPYPTIHCDLLAGGKTYEGERNLGPYKNTAFLIDQNSQIVGRYVKRSLMPIGEYVPGEKWFPYLRDLAALSTELIRGVSDAPLTLSSGTKAGMLVCYEDMVADNASSSVREGAECLIALANGSAFKDPDTLQQHLKLAQLRTIENRRALIRCAATGVTCLVQPDGTITDRLAIGENGVLLARVPLVQSLTFYTRYGEWFSIMSITLTVVYIASLPFRKRPIQDSVNHDASQA
jgi:apolipoprotein N-acyltransferase